MSRFSSTIPQRLCVDLTFLPQEPQSGKDMLLNQRKRTNDQSKKVNEKDIDKI
jgi:hypothetical protein